MHIKVTANKSQWMHKVKSEWQGTGGNRKQIDSMIESWLDDLVGVNESLRITSHRVSVFRWKLPSFTSRSPSVPAALMNRVMTDHCIVILHPSPSPSRHTLPSQKSVLAGWKSLRLWLAVLQSISTWKNKPAFTGRLKQSHHRVKYRCIIPPFSQIQMD